MGRKMASVGSVMLAVLGIAGLGAAWQVAHPPRGVFCTVAGSIGTPVADTPEHAFELWWKKGHPDGPTMEEGHIDHSGPRQWDIDKGTSDWVQVQVDRADHFDPERPYDKWSVSGANSCGYADE